MSFVKNNIIFSIVCLVMLTSCLKTRADVNEQVQQQVIGQTMADNQVAAATASYDATAESPKFVDNDTLIRELNGRVESLENKLEQSEIQKNTVEKQNAEKILLLQEALTKMELQVQRLENELPINKETEKNVKALDIDSSAKKENPYDVAQAQFAKKEYKKAILNYQKYTEEFPKGKTIADAKYKMGLCFQSLGMKEEAMAFYEEVVAAYPKTEAGKQAKAKLSKLK